MTLVESASRRFKTLQASPSVAAFIVVIEMTLSGISSFFSIFPKKLSLPTEKHLA